MPDSDIYLTRIIPTGKTVNRYRYSYRYSRFDGSQFEPGEKDPKITMEEKLMCDAPLSEGEIFDAIMTLKANKCPGLDGLPPEFYREFFKDLIDPLMQMYTYAFKNGILPATTRKGLITLIPKKDKDTRRIQNKRPITILGADYKILAKANGQ